MANNSRKSTFPKDGFIMQAGILAVAGILSRVIGLLYNSPMTAIIGDLGNGYYEFAYKAYAIILLVSSYSIPSAISKVIAQRLAAREYRNAHKIFKGALLYVVLVGGIASLLVFFFADYMVNVSNSVVVLRFFAPTIFLSGILGVLRGYFQAHKTMMQTSVSQILEQILNAAVSIWLAFVLTRMVPETETARRATYGAVGGAVGTGMGVVGGLLFMLAIYGLNRKTIKRRIERDKTPEEDSYGEIFKMILLVVTPFILSTFIYNINTYLNQRLFNDVMIIKGITEEELVPMISAIGKATKISNIPIAISSAMSAALIPGISGDFSQGFRDLCRGKVGKAIRTTMFISIPAAVGMGVLAKPIMLVLYPQKAVLDMSSGLLMVMSASVIFYALSTLSSAVLQGIGKVNSPVVNSTAALIVQTGVLIAILWFTKLGIYAMAVAVVLYAFLMCIFNGISVRKHLEYKQEWDKTFIRPLIASILMGGAAFGIYHGIYYLCGINIISLGIAVAVGVVIYFFLAVKWKIVSEGELKFIPKGASLVRLINGENSKKHKKKRPQKKKRMEKKSEEEDFWLDE